jgi:hypothetical protein
MSGYRTTENEDCIRGVQEFMLRAHWGFVNFVHLTTVLG